MANFTESNEWAAGVRIVEPGDKVLGGLGSAVNLPFQALANRTLFNKNAIAAAVASINSLSADKADKTVNFSAGAGLTGGGTLAASRTIALATPSTLSGSTANWAGSGATGHTHALAAASPTLAGVLKVLNVLTSSDNLSALSALQGKVLADMIAAAIASINSLSADKADKTVNFSAGAGLTGGGTLAASRTIALGTPGKITASTTNSVGDATHTHEIDKASTSVAGIVMLVDALTSTDKSKALTAAQGEVLAGMIAAAVASINSLSAAKADKTVNMTAGAGLTGGGTLAASRTITLGTPGKITASTTNSVGDATHTHEIDNASTTVAGVVKLNDTMSSKSATEALTANQGRLLNNGIAARLKTTDLAAETAKLVTRRNYTRTITGTADSSKSMSVAGNVTVYPDGRIVQIIHVKDLRVIWFGLESAGVGFNGGRHRRLPLQLWTAMPNAVTDVRPVFIRATNAAASQTYVGEAAEWICAWSLFAQGGSKTAVNIDASRFRGDSDEPIDLYVVIEGY